MTERIDHVSAAKGWIANSVNAQASKQPNNEQLATAYAGVAQVHATLALVEQQRIANLIAFGDAKREDLIWAAEGDELLDWLRDGDGVAGYLSTAQKEDLGVE